MRILELENELSAAENQLAEQEAAGQSLASKLAAVEAQHAERVSDLEAHNWRIEDLRTQVGRLQALMSGQAAHRHLGQHHTSVLHAKYSRAQRHPHPRSATHGPLLPCCRWMNSKLQLP